MATCLYSFFLVVGGCVTVTLVLEGNNFVLAGKSMVLNGEDAYTVCLARTFCPLHFLIFFLAVNYPISD